MDIKCNKDIIDFLANPDEARLAKIHNWLKGNIDNCDRKDVASIILQIIDVSISNLNKNSIIDFAEGSISLFSNHFPQYFSQKLQLINRLSKLYIEYEQIDKAHKKATSYLYNSIARLNSKAKNHEIEYYSFRNFSPYAINDIKNETISVAHPREFNDPFDTLFNLWLDLSIDNDNLDNIEREFRILLRKSAEHLKMRCLISASKKNDSCIEPVPIEKLDTLMWAHYANSHKGFCVKYKFPEDFFFDYNLSENKSLRMICGMEYNDNIKLSLDSVPDQNMAILTKSNNWAYENEMRLISYDVEEHKDDKGIIIDEPEFPIFKCSGAAKAVYLGIKCSDANRRMMEAAIGDKNIELYQMVYDPINMKKLKAKRIG